MIFQYSVHTVKSFCPYGLGKPQYFLKYSAKFREIFVRIGAKFDEKVLKTSDFTEIEAKI